MPPVPADAFSREIRSLTSSERAAFVADLWEAQGWETRVDGNVVVADRDGETERLRVVDPGRFGTPELDGVDRLVVARDRDGVRRVAEEAGVEYVPPDALRDVLLYGVCRSTAEELYERHVGKPLARAAPAPDTDSPEAGGGVTLPTVPVGRRAVAAVLVLALVGAALAGPAIPVGTSNPVATPGTISTTPEDEPAGAVGAIDTATPTPAREPEVVPGMSLSGVESAPVLTVAHLRSIRNRSRVRAVRLRGPVGAPFMGGTSSQNLTTWTENRSHYFNRIRAVRDSGNDSRPLEVATYADGSGTVYERFSGTNVTRYTRLSLAERPSTYYDAAVEGYLYRYFVTVDNTVVTCQIAYDTDCPTYRVEIDGEVPSTLPEGVEDYDALMIVSEDGVITTMRASYTLPDTDGDGEREPVSFALDYRFEPVEPPTPAWLDEAKNETAD
ncbi:hypothetical protein JCM30237_03220 [Halolamina litorea]|uniref:Uncharacterized protein n=1 Tax=Halolamina litorea TaxID=1515593 RepID=A0ABD6BT66_9EURY|nr:hypothetical protein [Halolamina litorea]